MKQSLTDGDVCQGHLTGQDEVEGALNRDGERRQTIVMTTWIPNYCPLILYTKATRMPVIRTCTMDL